MLSVCLKTALEHLLRRRSRSSDLLEPQEVCLADLYTRLSHDEVGCGLFGQKSANDQQCHAGQRCTNPVEVEVRQHEVLQVNQTVELHLLGTQLYSDLLVLQYNTSH